MEVAFLMFDECHGTITLPRPAQKVELTNVLGVNQQTVVHGVYFLCLLMKSPIVRGNEVTGMIPCHSASGITPRGEEPVLLRL